MLKRGKEKFSVFFLRWKMKGEWEVLLLDKCQFMPNFIKHIEKGIVVGVKMVGRDWGGGFVSSLEMWNLLSERCAYRKHPRFSFSVESVIACDIDPVLWNYPVEIKQSLIIRWLNWEKTSYAIFSKRKKIIDQTSHFTCCVYCPCLPPKKCDLNRDARSFVQTTLAGVVSVIFG